jgi:hypothetical protein
MIAVANTWAKRIGLTFGVLEFTGAVLWCVVIPFTVVDAKSGAFLIAGPLSVLPASILACYRPRWGGLWLIVGGVLSGYLIMFIIPHPNLRGGLHFEALMPLLLASVPMFVLGTWLMLATEQPPPTA